MPAPDLDDVAAPPEVIERAKILFWLIGLAEHIETEMPEGERAACRATVSYIIEQIEQGAHSGMPVEVQQWRAERVN